MIWRPVIEKDFGQERFLSQHPDEVFKDPKVPKKPVMIGITEDEMTYYVTGKNKEYTTFWHLITLKLFPDVLKQEAILEKIAENLNSFVADCFYLENYSKESKAIKHVYLPFDKIDHRSFTGLGNVNLIRF